jgi:hypothetical protein
VDALNFVHVRSIGLSSFQCVVTVLCPCRSVLNRVTRGRSVLSLSISADRYWWLLCGPLWPPRRLAALPATRPHRYGLPPLYCFASLLLSHAVSGVLSIARTYHSCCRSRTMPLCPASALDGHRPLWRHHLASHRHLGTAPLLPSRPLPLPLPNTPRDPTACARRHLGHAALAWEPAASRATIVLAQVNRPDPSRFSSSLLCCWVNRAMLSVACSTGPPP